ncbi:MAG: methylenetetrahydrofolate reductase [Firmicutes bacterium]|nr:methylenetetrahydrofolate reductase [NAD(P)H] [Bacillota bacterium]
MKITSLLKKNRPLLSFEMFPPKPGADFEKVAAAAQKTAALNPDFISVTYGAGGGNAANTEELAAYINNELKVPVLEHLTCVGSDKKSIDSALEKLSENKIENILALRGDIPEGMDFPQKDKFNYASELIARIKEAGDFCVGGACYPEGHVEAASFREDLNFLKLKASFGCDFFTSQMFFDNNIFYRFLYRLRDMGVKTPVFAGIMPVTRGGQIKRIIELSGSSLPHRFAVVLDKYGDDPAAMHQAGIAYATEQIVDLLANGVDGIHVYSMNDPEVAGSILNNIRDIIKL